MMNGTLLLFIVTIVFALGYRFYGGFLARLLGIDNRVKTPAHRLEDGVDFVPTHPAVLFGHHFSSIAGAGPIVGPILAAAFGWGSVLAWVVVGCLFVGAMHDMVSLFLSVRHEGMSVSSVLELFLGKSGKLLFLLSCLFALILVCAEFTRQIAMTFVQNPEVATSSGLFILIAVIFGLLVYRCHLKISVATIIFVPIMFGCIWLGMAFPLNLERLFGFSKEGASLAWTLIILGYCFVASTAPVWILLQPRDYLNSYLLYTMMALGFLGVIVASPSISMEAFSGLSAKMANGKMVNIFPMLFVTIACGACSGFHALVASGTTSKQLDKENHIRPIAYGGMLLEGILAVLAIIAIGHFSTDELTSQLKTASPVALFASGLSSFCAKLGIPSHIAFVFMCLAVSAFLMTSVDTTARLGRFTVRELIVTFSKNDDSAKVGSLIKFFCNKYVTTAIVIGVASILLLGNPSAGKDLWSTFASANQLMAALTLLTASLWLLKNHKTFMVTLIPMVFMLSVSVAGLYVLSKTSWQEKNLDVAIITTLLLTIAGALVVLSIVKVFKYRRG